MTVIEVSLVVVYWLESKGVRQSEHWRRARDTGRCQWMVNVSPALAGRSAHAEHDWILEREGSPKASGPDRVESITIIREPPKGRLGLRSRFKIRLPRGVVRERYLQTTDVEESKSGAFDGGSKKRIPVV